MTIHSGNLAASHHGVPYSREEGKRGAPYIPGLKAEVLRRDLITTTKVRPRPIVTML